jgi:nucleotide-binding universal stress UspA family protein
VTRLGNPAEEILVCAEEVDADLIALGAKGVGKVRRFLLGSVAHRVARYATCSVLAAREPGVLRSVLVATDCSPHANAAVSAFLALPLPNGLTTTALTVVPPEGGDEEAARACAQDVADRLSQAGMVATWQTASGNETEAVLKLADEQRSDLIVLGAGRHSVNGEPILGSVAFGVLDSASRSVFLGRAKATQR